MEKLQDFLNYFNIKKEDFESTGLKWEELIEIRVDYVNFKEELIDPASYLVNAFHRINPVHSVRYRIKDPNHLIEKIIRKRMEDPERVINIDNYKTEITDLIGLRALHLFKEDWLHIHNSINDKWDLVETPTAYFRKGDPIDYVKIFEDNGCSAKEHPYGYRSVHYLLKTSPNKNTYTSEVQVRTIFEEGWSEIDHKIRYPYNRDNQILAQFLIIFNRLSGSADEMGSYIKYLSKELEEIDDRNRKSVKEKTEIIEELKKRISNLELKPQEKKEWNSSLDKILIEDNVFSRINEITNQFSYLNHMTDIYDSFKVSQKLLEGTNVIKSISTKKRK